MDFRYSNIIADSLREPLQASKMKSFTTIIDAKVSILDVCGYSDNASE